MVVARLWWASAVVYGIALSHTYGALFMLERM